MPAALLQPKGRPAPVKQAPAAPAPAKQPVPAAATPGDPRITINNVMDLERFMADFLRARTATMLSTGLLTNAEGKNTSIVAAPDPQGDPDYFMFTNGTGGRVNPERFPVAAVPPRALVNWCVKLFKSKFPFKGSLQQEPIKIIPKLTAQQIAAGVLDKCLSSIPNSMFRFWTLKTWASKYYPQLGVDGSSRACFKLDEDHALKIAMNPAGIAQNLAESHVARKMHNLPITQVHHVCEGGQAMVVDFAHELNPAHFKRDFGMGFDAWAQLIHDIYLAGDDDPVLAQNLRSQMSPKGLQLMDDLEADDLLPTDLMRKENWGDLRNHAVIIDYGLSDQVWKEHYNKTGASLKTGATLTVKHDDPGLLTLDQYLTQQNPDDKSHPSESYNYTLDQMNPDYSVEPVGKSPDGSVICFKHSHGFTFKDPEGDLLGVSNGSTLWLRHPLKRLPTRYFQSGRGLGSSQDIDPGTPVQVKYPASHLNQVFDPERAMQERYPVVLQTLGEYQLRAEANPEGTRAANLALVHQGLVVAIAQSEWGATLISVAKEYHGHRLGQLIAKTWGALNPSYTSGGYTPAGKRTAIRVWSDRVRELLSHGVYSDLVAKGKLTKEQVDAITKNLQGRSPLGPPTAPGTASKGTKQFLLYCDGVTFVLYDAAYLQEQDETFIKGFGFLRDSPAVGNYFYALDYTPAFKETATAVALQMAKDEGSPLYVGEGYGDLLDPEGLPVERDGDYLSLTGNVLDLRNLAQKERAARKKVDPHGEIENTLLEQAHSKSWGSPEVLKAGSKTDAFYPQGKQHEPPPDPTDLLKGPGGSPVLKGAQRHARLLQPRGIIETGGDHGSRDKQEAKDGGTGNGTRGCGPRLPGRGDGHPGADPGQHRAGIRLRAAEWGRSNRVVVRKIKDSGRELRDLLDGQGQHIGYYGLSPDLQVKPHLLVLAVGPSLWHTYFTDALPGPGSGCRLASHKKAKLLQPKTASSATVRLYHGTSSDNAQLIMKNGFNTPWVYLTSDKAAAEEYGEIPGVSPGYAMAVTVPKAALYIDFDLGGDQVLDVEHANGYWNEPDWDIDDWLQRRGQFAVTQAVANAALGVTRRAKLLQPRGIIKEGGDHGSHSNTQDSGTRSDAARGGSRLCLAADHHPGSGPGEDGGSVRTSSASWNRPAAFVIRKIRNSGREVHDLVDAQNRVVGYFGVSAQHAHVMVLWMGPDQWEADLVEAPPSPGSGYRLASSMWAKLLQPKTAGLSLGQIVKRVGHSDAALRALDLGAHQGLDFQEGGCWMFAEALHSVLPGSRLEALASTANAVEHVVVNVGGTLYDSDGGFSPEAMLKKFHADWPDRKVVVAPFDPANVDEVEGAPYDRRVIRALKKLFEQALAKLN